MHAREQKGNRIFLTDDKRFGVPMWKQVEELKVWARYIEKSFWLREWRSGSSFSDSYEIWQVDK